MTLYSFQTPLGAMALTLLDGAVSALAWGEYADAQDARVSSDACAVRDQVLAYLQGQRSSFDCSLSLSGTSFQKRVWAAMGAIPYGEVRTYGDLARTLKSSPRAVGAACGANPVPLIVPCHRVVGQQGLVGYSGGDGVATKRFLLQLEGAI